VDLGRLSGVATHHDELVLVARAFDEHVELFADERLVLLLQDRALDGRELAVAALRGASWHLAFEMKAARSLLVRVAEQADAIELGPAHELAELVELFFRLARVAHDERGPEDEAGHPVAECAHDLAKARAAVAAPHPP